jgi:Pectate lyase superfamily protein
MTTPFTVTSPTTGTGVYSVDGAGNTLQAGTATGHGTILLPSAAPAVAPQGLGLYSPDGQTLWTVSGTGAESIVSAGSGAGGIDWINVKAEGATGNGITDDTAALQAALNKAGALNTGVFLPAGVYRTSGLTVPGGVTAIVGKTSMLRFTTPAVRGSVLAPINTSVSTLLTVGVSGAGSVNLANPHGLVVEGISFLGTVPAGTSVTNMWACQVIDTSDVVFFLCRDLYCDTYLSGPGGGMGTGGFLQVLSSGAGNGFSESCLVSHHRSYGCGNFMNVDGLSSSDSGSTDGRVVKTQVNSHQTGIALGAVHANAGGWILEDLHMSSPIATWHVTFGPGGTPWTLRTIGCYFDLVNGAAHILCNARGLNVVGCYFRMGNAANVTCIKTSGTSLSVHGRDPGAVIANNVVDLNSSTTATSFLTFQGWSAANAVLYGGGVYFNNMADNHGAAMPGSWIGTYIGNDATAVVSTTSATMTLAQGPTLSA